MANVKTKFQKECVMGQKVQRWFDSFWLEKLAEWQLLGNRSLGESGLWEMFTKKKNKQTQRIPLFLVPDNHPSILPNTTDAKILKAIVLYFLKLRCSYAFKIRKYNSVSIVGQYASNHKSSCFRNTTPKSYF